MQQNVNLIKTMKKTENSEQYLEKKITFATNNFKKQFCVVIHFHKRYALLFNQKKTF